MIFGDFWLQKNELQQNGWRWTKISLPANRNCCRLLCISWALAQISLF